MPSFTGKVSKPWLIVAAATAVAFIANGTRMSYGVFLVPLEQALSITRSQAVLPLSFFMIVSGVAQPFTGVLMDAKGPRRAIVLAVVLSALGFIVAAFSQNLWQLILGYGVVIGVASSGFAVTPFSLLINRWFPQQQRGTALGIVVAAFPLSLLIFSPLAAFLIPNFDWRVAFLILAAIMLLVVVPISWFFIREPNKVENTATKVSTRGLFINSEILQAIKGKPYWVIIVKYFGCGFGGAFIAGHLPAIALQQGFSAQEGATALGLWGGGGAVGLVVGGWLADRIGPYQPLVVSFLIRAVGVFLLVFFVSDVASLYIISVIAGITVLVCVSLTHMIIYEIYGPGIAGRMMGLTFLIHQVGAALGPYYGGWIFEIDGNYTLALIISGFILLNSAFWAWRLQGVAQRYISTRVSS